MDSITQNVPDVIRQEAKQRALKIIESNTGCISYVKAEDLETQSLFVPVVSVIKPAQGDFHEYIEGIGILPKVPLMNLMGEKAGVHIIRTETAKRGEYVWVAHTFGERRQPDGTMRPDDASYEFDAEKRAEMDFLKDSKKEKSKQKYTTEKEQRLYVLQLCKFAEQRAVTGAQLALIHKLAKLPASFKTPEELMRGMIVVRYDRNVDGIMQDPSMRREIIDHALGVTETIYGPPKQLPAAPVVRTYDEEGERIGQPAAPQGDLFEDEDPPAPAAAPEPSPLDNARALLEAYREKIKVLPPGATKKLEATLAKKDATLEEVNALIDRFVVALQAKAGAA